MPGIERVPQPEQARAENRADAFFEDLRLEIPQVAPRKLWEKDMPDIKKTIGQQLGSEYDPNIIEKSEAFPTNDKVGIEIELEGVSDKLRRSPFKYWRVVNDGSLRNNGCEFITAGRGLAGSALDMALKEMDESLRESRVEISDRCSIHVHLDFNKGTDEEVINFFSVYTIFEDLMYEISGKRNDNNYCVPLSAVEEDFRRIGIANKNGGILINSNRIERYCGFNVNSLAKYGTVEIRIHEGTKDVDRIRKWVETLLYLKKFSKDFDVFSVDLSTLSRMGAIGLLNTIFPQSILEYYNMFSLQHLVNFRNVQKVIFDNQTFRSKMKTPVLSERTMKDLVNLGFICVESN